MTHPDWNPLLPHQGGWELTALTTSEVAAFRSGLDKGPRAAPSHTPRKHTAIILDKAKTHLAKYPNEVSGLVVAHRLSLGSRADRVAPLVESLRLVSASVTWQPFRFYEDNRDPGPTHTQLMVVPGSELPSPDAIFQHDAFAALRDRPPSLQRQLPMVAGYVILRADSAKVGFVDVFTGAGVAPTPLPVTQEVDVTLSEAYRNIL